MEAGQEEEEEEEGQVLYLITVRVDNYITVYNKLFLVKK